MMIISLLFISHLVGDFILQSSSDTEKKQQYFSKLLKHCVIYISVVALFLIISADLNKLPIILTIIGFSHLLIDYIKVIYDKKATERGKLFSYFIDQLLHLSVILFVVLYFNLESHIGGLIQSSVIKFGTTHTNNFIIYSLLYLTMLQPAAITVKRILIYISGSDKEETPPYNAGYLIGILERIIITTLVLQNQLSAIGFVLAAKSIARFNQLNDKEFAEKYLVGTLTSISISFIITTILKIMII